MFSDFLENIKQHHKAELPFVAYRKPNEDSVKALFQDDMALYEAKSFTKEGFVFAPFDSNTPAILLKPDRIDKATFLSTANSSKSDGIEPNISEVEKIYHTNLVKKGIREIESGRLKKVVLSRAIKSKDEIHPTSVFERLLANYSSAFCYIWFHPKVGLWLGATPEKFLKLENGQLTTNSLAGTQAYTGNLNPHWGNKEKEEQQLVTDYIHDALKNIVSDIVVSEVSTIKAGNLLHLKTSITGRMRPDLLPEVIRQLHPTPAVCGLPKESSRNFILEHENYDREFYTGFLGELNLTSETKRNSNKKNIENGAYRSVKKSTELFVNLRCLQVVDKKAIVYVGGGITRDSNPKSEWEETVSKSRTMLKVLYAK
jgi:isochorismate synthase